MEEGLARGVQFFLALAGAYLLTLWFALVVWTYRDIGSRSQSVITQVFATMLVVLFSIPGALLYLLLRPRASLDEAFQRSLEEEYLLQDLEELLVCHSCHRAVSNDYVLCPHCQTTLRDTCGACGKLVSIRWPVCPYCGSDQSERAAAIRERVEPPAERFLERGQRTFRQLTGSSIREITFREPEIEMPYEPELTAGEYETPVVAAETFAEEEQAPIRLFDRKRTRAKKARKSTATTKTGTDVDHAGSSPDDEKETFAQPVSGEGSRFSHNGDRTSLDPEPAAAGMQDSASSNGVQNEESVVDTTSVGTTHR